MLRDFPFTCRKIGDANLFWRERGISLDVAGYVAITDIEGEIEGMAKRQQAKARAMSPFWRSVISAKRMTSGLGTPVLNDWGSGGKGGRLSQRSSEPRSGAGIEQIVREPEGGAR